MLTTNSRVKRVKLHLLKLISCNVKKLKWLDFKQLLVSRIELLNIDIIRFGVGLPLAFIPSEMQVSARGKKNRGTIDRWYREKIEGTGKET